LVDANGSAGACIHNEWLFVFHLAAWRDSSGLVIKTRRCEMPVMHSDLKELMNRVRAYEVVEVEIDPSAPGPHTRVKRLRGTRISDAGLAQVAAELKKPLVLTHAVLGSLEYQRNYGWYSGHATWLGEKVELTLSCDPMQPDAVVAFAMAMLSTQLEWRERLNKCLVGELLSLKNRAWLDEQEAALKDVEFLARVSLKAIAVDVPDHITFWYSDGEMFGGHDIEIRANAEGITEAGLAG
jgi:hypothetical protein